MDIRYDPAQDTVLSLEGRDLATAGLQWAAALVPLVKNAKPVPSVEIARNDYDLRQIFGRQADQEIAGAYRGWFGEWDRCVGRMVEGHVATRRPFAVFYHSILGINRSGEIVVDQMDGDLPGLAEALAAEGVVSAGLLDSGGSCALDDPWLRGYRNHGWYFRERRGAILLFELAAAERLPDGRSGCWLPAGSV